MAALYLISDRFSYTTPWDTIQAAAFAIGLRFENQQWRAIENARWATRIEKRDAHTIP